MHRQENTKTNLTIRVDCKVKEKLEVACEYLGLTITAVFNKAVRQTLDEYHKQRSLDTKIAREIADGDNYQFMYAASQREVLALKTLGFDSVLEVNPNIDAVRYRMYYEFIYQQICNDLNLPFVHPIRQIKHAEPQ